MNTSKLTKTRLLLIVVGVIVAIIISLQTTAFSLQDLDKMAKVRAIKEQPKNVMNHIENHIIEKFYSTLK